MSPILTIGITSYKRVNELKRCINSIHTKCIDDIEILISEDHSPLSQEIETEVSKLIPNSHYTIRFTTNDVNLGYDMNLGALIKKAKGKYIFFLSDDDIVAENCLDEIIEYLKGDIKCGVLYSPFLYYDTNKIDRNRGNKNFPIVPSKKNAARYIYDAILFSGLIFRIDYVINYDSARFKNYNYFQVYLFLQMMYKYGGYYFANPSIVCISDGENAYGLSESSKDKSDLENSKRNILLANRKSVKSNLEFNKTLIKTIRVFDEENGTKIIDDFSLQYSIHSISGLTLARKEGKEYFNEYYNTLNELDINLHFVIKCYYVLLNVFGAGITTKLLSIFRKTIKKEK